MEHEEAEEDGDQEADLRAGEAGGGAAQRDDLPDGHHVILVVGLPHWRQDGATSAGSSLLQECQESEVILGGAGSGSGVTGGVAEEVRRVSGASPERLTGKRKLMCNVVVGRHG